MEHTADGSLPQTLSPTDSEHQWAALAHLSALVLALMTSWIAGAAGVLAAVVVYMIKRDDSPFASAHAREAINFNLSMFIYACVRSAAHTSELQSLMRSSYAVSCLKTKNN